jgi:protein-arginine kinase activator protein McsA
MTNEEFDRRCRDRAVAESYNSRHTIERLEAEIERLRTYVGSQMLRSDFQTADEMRVEINRLRAEGDRYRWLLSQPI